MTSKTKLFIDQAAAYAAARPTYPADLYDRLFRFVGRRPGVVVDVAAGNGQASEELARNADHVVALDVSETQIAETVGRRSPVAYAVGDAHHLPVRTGGADLVTVAQALHWMDLDRFYPEVDRVLSPGGVFAAWGYAVCTLHNDEADRRLDHFYNKTIGPYWSPERKIVEDEYRGLRLPFAETARESTPMAKMMSIDAFLGYLNSWSAVAKYKRAHPGEDPVKAFAPALREALGNASEIKVTWPVFVMMARKGGKIEL